MIDALGRSVGYVEDARGHVYSMPGWELVLPDRDDVRALESASMFDAPTVTPVVIVPEVVLMSSARKVLRRYGLTDAIVRAAIAQIADEDEREDALIDWEFHPTVRKTSPLVAKVAPLLNLSPVQIDAMLVEAGSLE